MLQRSVGGRLPYWNSGDLSATSACSIPFLALKAKVNFVFILIIEIFVKLL
jgi:hypothetical protein